MSQEMIRKCAKDRCPSQNIIPDLTWHCHHCKNPIHLICYGITKAPEEVFVSDNVVMVCDECLANPTLHGSPKRKQANSTPTLSQRTIDTNSQFIQLSKVTVDASVPKSGVSKQNQQMQAVMESLVNKFEAQTENIAKLKVSVDSMSNTISRQNINVEKSMLLSNTNMTSIRQVLGETKDVVLSAIKNSYAAVVKEGIHQINETPKSSLRGKGVTPGSHKPARTPKTDKPVMSGTSAKVIGKPLSPISQNPRNARSKIDYATQKAIWVSKLHRDTTEEELETFVKELSGAAETGQYQVRKLVKKDRALSSYSFVSFKVTCPENMLSTLLDVSKWPSNCQIREFDLDRNASTGVRLNVHSKNDRVSATDQSKNELMSPITIMET